MEMQQGRRLAGGFTLLEMATVLVVIGILATLLLPAIENIRLRVEKVQCMSNLRNLYAAASGYVQQNGHWPQIDTHLLATDKKAYAAAWIAALQPMGLAPKNWICPTVQRTNNNPNYLQPNLARVDYIAMPFDNKESTPYRWPSQPWFVENGDVHGNGNLIIFTDGSIRELNEVRTSPPPSSAQ